MEFLIPSTSSAQRAMSQLLPLGEKGEVDGDLVHGF